MKVERLLSHSTNKTEEDTTSHGSGVNPAKTIICCNEADKMWNFSVSHVET
jgi:hypothetical protein